MPFDIGVVFGFQLEAENIWNWIALSLKTGILFFGGGFSIFLRFVFV